MWIANFEAEKGQQNKETMGEKGWEKEKKKIKREKEKGERRMLVEIVFLHDEFKEIEKR